MCHLEAMLGGFELHQSLEDCVDRHNGTFLVRATQVGEDLRERYEDRCTRPSSVEHLTCVVAIGTRWTIRGVRNNNQEDTKIN